MDVMVIRRMETLQKVMDLPALTVVGLRAQAAILHNITLNDAITFTHQTIDDAAPHERLAFAVAEDVLRGVMA